MSVEPQWKIKSRRFAGRHRGRPFAVASALQRLLQEHCGEITPKSTYGWMDDVYGRQYMYHNSIVDVENVKGFI